MFVERSNRDGEETVILRYAAAFYWLMWPTVILSLLLSVVSTTLTGVAVAAAWLLLLCVAIPYWPVIFQLKRQMRNGPIVASGSKYSFSNPLTYRWRVNDDNDTNN